MKKATIIITAFAVVGFLFNGPLFSQNARIKIDTDRIIGEVNPDIKAVNDFGNEVVRTVEKPQVRARGDQITYTFPPLSVTMLKGRIH